jgi:hypothetical protein
MGIFKKREKKLNPNNIKSVVVNIPDEQVDKVVNAYDKMLKGPHDGKTTVTGIRRNNEDE